MLIVCILTTTGRQLAGCQCTLWQRILLRSKVPNNQPFEFRIPPFEDNMNAVILPMPASLSSHFT